MRLCDAGRAVTHAALRSAALPICRGLQEAKAALTKAALSGADEGAAAASLAAGGRRRGTGVGVDDVRQLLDLAA